MSLPPSTTTISPRHLVLRALASAKELAADSNTSLKDERNENQPLKEGEEQVFSFFKPALEGGDYVVSTSQEISDGKVTIPKGNEQEFTVETPQFQIPADAIKSLYPPTGYGTPAQTLPHIAFNDPYLPWEREASTKIKSTDVYRVPWLALLAFTPDELRMKPEHLTGDTSLFKNISASPPFTAKQDSSLAISLPLRQIQKLIDCQTPIDATATGDAETKVDSIFLKPDLFSELFRNNTVPPKEQDFPDLSRYGFLSHVRKFNTSGMADAAKEAYAHYSICVSHRTGPLNQREPAPVVVHLISLEGIENMKLPIPESVQYVALASLYSWTYTCLPPGSFDVQSLMRNLGTSLGMLRGNVPSDESIKDDGLKHVAERIKEGYTLTRHRVQTGEVTAAIFRGALSPTRVARPLSPSWNVISDCGLDLQILDDTLGLMDITYSAAWQLGKATAIADQAFSTNLTKLRTKIHVMAMNQAKAKILKAQGLYRTKSDAIKSAPAVVRDLNFFQDSEDSETPKQQNVVDRWIGTVKDPVDLSLNNEALVDEYAKSALKAAEELAKSADIDDEAIYNELNTPSNPEWQLVLSWILDKMFLSTIPAHYLLVDPGHLPPESLKFFHIDASWIDAFLDGALSVGNHLEVRFDKVRIALKRLVNNYIVTPLPITGKPPPIPSYGFFMRSDIVSHFPDLRVSAEYAPPRTDTVTPSILRQINVTDGVLLCLLEISPFSTSGSKLTRLSFTQPPHQQSFTVGDFIDTKKLRTIYRRIYMWDDGSSKSDPLCKEEELECSAPLNANDPPIFNWGPDNSLRLLQFPAWSDRLLERLQKNMPDNGNKTFQSDSMTSAMVGIQLTNPVIELQITASEELLSLPLPSTDSLRTLWVPPKQPPATQPSLPSPQALPHSASQTVTPLEPAKIRRRVVEIPPTSVPPHQTSGKITAGDMTDRVKKTLDSSMDSGPAGTPTYSVQVFPVGNFVDPTTETSRVPMGNRQDLVFSVTLVNPDLVGDFFISELQIVVPMRAVEPKGRGYLLTDYQGPGPTMLSNLRFNVISSKAADYSHMLFRLIPRTTDKNGIRFQKAKEVSFLLSLIDVNVYPVEEKMSYITVIEYYKDEYGFDIGPFAKEFPTVLTSPKS